MTDAKLVARTHDEQDDERGFVLVWLAIVLVLLLSIAAFAVDLVHAYAEAQRVQNAVDAAALAGASQIPSDLNGDAAKHRVKELLKSNGFDTDDPACNCALIENDIDANNPNQMNVQMRLTFDTYFARIMGFSQLSVRRTAYGQYDAKVEMGSPQNNLGDVPYDGAQSACADLNPIWNAGNSAHCARIFSNARQNLWLQITGRDTRKASGNAYSGEYCHNPATGIDGCTAPNGLNNNEYSADGQYYVVHNDVPGSKLVIAVYDAGFVHVGGGVGSFCNPATNDITNVTSPLNPRHTRYYNGSPFCAGDTTQNGRNDAATCPGPDGPVVECGRKFATQFDVLAADDTPNDPTDNDVLDSGECGNGGAPWNVPGEAPAAGTPITKVGTASDGTANGTVNIPTVDWFQQYRVLCTLNTTHGTFDDYIVRVRAPEGQGTNNFSILALHDQTLPPTGRLNVFTRQRLPLFVSKPAGGGADFFVARIQPAARDRVLELELFDLGDSPTASPDGHIEVGVHNASIPNNGHKFNCTYTAPPGVQTGSEPEGGPWDQQRPWGAPPDLNEPGCDGVVYDGAWNGQWVSIKITIPGQASGGYTCNTGPLATPDDCWITMRIVPNSGTMSDATTWNARLSGAPVRLVK